MHASQLFDCYRMLTHPGPALIPAALANAELEGWEYMMTTAPLKFTLGTGCPVNPIAVF